MTLAIPSTHGCTDRQIVQKQLSDAYAVLYDADTLSASPKTRTVYNFARTTAFTSPRVELAQTLADASL